MFLFLFQVASATEKGGKTNDSVSTSLPINHSSVSSKKNVLEMNENELAAFIDETFELDSIPPELIYQINLAVARIERKDDYAHVDPMNNKNITTIPLNKTTILANELKKAVVVASVPKPQPLAMNTSFLPQNTNNTVRVNELKPHPVIHQEPIEAIRNTNITSLAAISPTQIEISELNKTQQIIVKEEPQLMASTGTIIPEALTHPIVAQDLNHHRIFSNATHLNAFDKKISLVAPQQESTGIVAMKLVNTPTLSTPEELTIFEKGRVFIHTDDYAVNEVLLNLSLNEFTTKNTSLAIENTVNEEVKPVEDVSENCNLSTTISSNTSEIKTHSETNSNCINPSKTNTSILSTTSNGDKVIPSLEHYVSWEINKLFPENDMLKIKKDSTLNLTLLDKEHKQYTHPFNGPVTSMFGWRDSAQHNGIDIDLNKGDKVVAAFDGMVRVARRYGNFGNVVIIRHYNGLETVYAHLSKIKVKPEQIVKSGELVGLGGSTGRSTGTHLHFEVRFKGVPINPKYIISLNEQKLMCDEFCLKKTKWGLAVYPKHIKQYTVQKGDTVFEIAKRFGTSTASIKELNNFNSSRMRLKAGQIIVVAR